MQKFSLKKNGVRLLIGILIVLLSQWFLSYFQDRAELTYEIDGPTTYLDNSVTQDVEIKVNDLVVPGLFAYRYRIWNSGDVPIAGLALSVRFENVPPSFEMFSVRHQTVPTYEFGEILDVEQGADFKRFGYPPMNPGDSDEITLLTNTALETMLDAKAEGVNVVQSNPTKVSWWASARPWVFWLSSAVALLSFLVYDRMVNMLVHQKDIADLSPAEFSAKLDVLKAQLEDKLNEDV